MKTLKGKNVASPQMPPQMANKSPSQFVYSNVPKPAKKKGLKMLGSAMSKLSAKKY